MISLVKYYSHKLGPFQNTKINSVEFVILKFKNKTTEENVYHHFSALWLRSSAEEMCNLRETFSTKKENSKTKKEKERHN